MDRLLWARVCAGFLVDVSLALLCGLLLAERWLGRMTGESLSGGVAAEQTLSASRGMKIFSGLLCLGSCWQLILLTITFSGESGLHAIATMMPDVCGTHAGGVLLATCVDAGWLFAAAALLAGALRSSVCGVLALLYVGLHGMIGHAAVDGIFSWAEGLQWVHLLGMALWGGGVLVSGLLVVPRISSAEKVEAGKVRRYLECLSTLSTWCVALVLLSGVVKGYRATGSIAAIRSSYWGHILLLKAAAVTLTVCLGARNRWLLGSSAHWDEASVRSATRTLWAESVCMAGVLLLSAWLANSPLPME